MFEPVINPPNLPVVRFIVSVVLRGGLAEPLKVAHGQKNRHSVYIISD
jgi:hypothetical protein